MRQIGPYVASINEKFARMQDRFVVTTGADLASLLESMDQRDVARVVDGASVWHPMAQIRCGCTICIDEQQIFEAGTSLHADIFLALRDVYDLFTQVGVRNRNDYVVMETNNYARKALDLLNRCPHCTELKGIRDRLDSLVEGPVTNGDCEACNRLLKDYHSYPQEARDVPVDEVKFTHNTCSTVFSEGPHAGQRISDLLEALQCKTVLPCQVPIDVVRHIWLSKRSTSFRWQFAAVFQCPFARCGWSFRLCLRAYLSI